MNKEELLNYFEKTDSRLYNNFIKAPASTKYHGSYEGGLLEHSVNVMNNLLQWREKHLSCELTEEDCVIIGLLHDLCKAELYIKQLGGGYNYNKSIVSHHAKLSVDMITYRLSLKLTPLQRVLILLHMSSWENEEDKKELTTDDLDWLYTPDHIQLLQAMNWADMKASEDERIKELTGDKKI